MGVGAVFSWPCPVLLLNVRLSESSCKKLDIQRASQAVGQLPVGLQSGVFIRSRSVYDERPVKGAPAALRIELRSQRVLL